MASRADADVVAYLRARDGVRFVADRVDMPAGLADEHIAELTDIACGSQGLRAVMTPDRRGRPVLEEIAQLLAIGAGFFCSHGQWHGMFPCTIRCTSEE